MATDLSTADVERVAALAHLELTDAEKQLFTRQIADVLHYAEQIQSLDTAGVPATAHVNAAQREREGPLGMPRSGEFFHRNTVLDRRQKGGRWRTPPVL